MSLQTRRVLRRAENACDVHHNLSLFWPRCSCLAKEYVFLNAFYVIKIVMELSIRGRKWLERRGLKTAVQEDMDELKVILGESD